MHGLVALSNYQTLNNNWKKSIKVIVNKPVDRRRAQVGESNDVMQKFTSFWVSQTVARVSEVTFLYLSVVLFATLWKFSFFCLKAGRWEKNTNFSRLAHSICFAIWFTFASSVDLKTSAFKMLADSNIGQRAIYREQSESTSKPTLN